MIDLVQAQADLTAILLSSDQLKSINVFSYREQRIKQETDYRTLLITPRNGCVGAMVQVLMPEGLGKNPNVTGPVIDWEFSIVVHEMPDINMKTTINVGNAAYSGTLMTAEEIAQIVMDILHLEADDKLGTFFVSARAISVEKEYVFPGCIGYRVHLTIVGRNIQTTRCAPVTIAVNSTPVTTTTCSSGTCTLACITPNARIKFTLDGSYPTEDIGGNSSSSLYTAPFTLSSGEILRTAAYLAGLNKSATRYALVS